MNSQNFNQGNNNSILLDIVPSGTDVAPLDSEDPATEGSKTFEDVNDFIVSSIIILLIIIISFIAMKFYKERVNRFLHQIQHVLVGMFMSLVFKKKVDAVYDLVRLTDPDFSKDLLLVLVNDMFIRYTEAWEKRDWQSIRVFETDELFQLHSSEMEQMAKDNKRIVLKDAKILKTELLSFNTEVNVDRLRVHISARLIKYVMDDKTGKALEGNKEKSVIKNFIWVIIRKKGLRTDFKRHDIKALSCRSCGANLSINASGDCDKCNAHVSDGDFGWVLSAIESET